jgi:hypothetical protein
VRDNLLNEERDIENFRNWNEVIRYGLYDNN